MGEDCEAWHHQLHFNWQSPYPNSSGAEQGMGLFAHLNPGASVASVKGTLPSYGLLETPNLPLGQASEPHGWSYCLPRFRQAFTPAPPSILKEQFPAFHNESCREIPKPNVGSGGAQKRFLVVDHSAGQTTLILSSGVGDPVRCLASWRRNHNDAYNWCMEDARTERALKNLSEPVLTDEFNENNETGAESEMHEDTEELDALLYSDDDDDGDPTEDDEVTSTGHSPSTMTSFDKQEWFGGGTDEVASSSGSTKKRKLFDGGYDGKPSLMDTASSAKPNRSLELEDDAESSCANDKSYGSRELDVSSCNKKIRKDKIRETVSILQTIIPDGEGKDAIVVLDEAIQYLKSLKLKAKAFGFDAL